MKDRYEEALNTAKMWYENTETSPYIRGVLREIFPELAESEDERIRKELLAVVGDLVLPNEQQSRFVAWLEKQGQVKDSANFQHENKMCKENGDSLTNEDEKVRKALIEYFNEQCDMSDWNGVYGYQVVAWLEKQGKISPILSNSSNIGKVEPKFKVGDWVVEHATNRPVQIVRYEERSDGTLVWFNNGTGIYVDFLCGYHLWTTQDAKDGDVLALNNEVFIYAHRKQMYPVAVAHCYVDSAGGFYHGGEFSYIEKGNSIYPATKEQRDLLEKAMTDAGYTFDFEKKELKKITAPKSDADDKIEPRFKVGDWVMNKSGATFSNGSISACVSRIEGHKIWLEHGTYVNEWELKKLTD